MKNLDWKKIAWILAPTILLVVLACIALVIRVPARVKLQVRVDDFSWVLSEQKPIQILNVAFSSLAVKSFDVIEFEPASLTISMDEKRWERLEASETKLSNFDPGYSPSVELYQKKTGPQSTWNPIFSVTAGEASKIRLKTSQGRVHIELASALNQTEPDFTAEVSLPDRNLMLKSDNIQLFNGKTSKIITDEAYYQVELSPVKPLLSLRPLPGGLKASLVLNTNIRKEDMFPQKSLQIKSISMVKLEQENWVTSLQEDTVIGYPDFPQIPPSEIHKNDYLSLDGLKGFEIRQISFSDDNSSFLLSLEGFAAKIRSGTKNNLKELSPSIMSILWKNPVLLILIAIGSWALSTTLSIRKFLSENQKKNKKGAKNV